MTTDWMKKLLDDSENMFNRMIITILCLALIVVILIGILIWKCI